MTPARPVPRRVLFAVVLLLVACAEEPDRGAALTAALAASGAYDALDDLGVVGDPDAAGTRDAFRAATVAALERALEAHRAAPRATAEAHRASLYAGELADRFGLAVAAALDARGDLKAALEAAEDLLVVRRRLETRTEADARLVEYRTASAAYDAALDRSRSGGGDFPTAEAAASIVAADALDDARAAARAARTDYLVRFRQRDSPAPADLDGASTSSAALVAELRADTAAKIETAEDLRRQAMSAYRAAAEAWRALTA